MSKGDTFSSFISVFLLQPILILHYSPGKDRHYISLYCLGSACKRKYRSLRYPLCDVGYSSNIPAFFIMVSRSDFSSIFEYWTSMGFLAS